MEENIVHLQREMELYRWFQPKKITKPISSELSDLTVKCFIKSMKKRKLLCIVADMVDWKFFKNLNLVRGKYKQMSMNKNPQVPNTIGFDYRFFADYLQSIRSRKRILGSCKNISELSSYIRDNTYVNIDGGLDDISNEEYEQLFIEGMVNTLLVNTIGNTLWGSATVIQDIGKDVFNMVCGYLYGKGFEDLTERNKKRIDKRMKDFLSKMEFGSGSITSSDAFNRLCFDYPNLYQDNISIPTTYSDSIF